MEASHKGLMTSKTTSASIGRNHEIADLMPPSQVFNSHEALSLFQSSNYADDNEIFDVAMFTADSITSSRFMKPLYVGDFADNRFFMDFTWAEDPPLRREWCDETESWIIQDYRRGRGGHPDGLMQWGIGVAGLMHHGLDDPFYAELKVQNIERQHVDYSGFNILLDTLARDLWLTPCADSWDWSWQDYFVMDLRDGWGRELPGDRRLIGAMRISQAGWETAMPDDLHRFITFGGFPFFETTLRAARMANLKEYAEAYESRRVRSDPVGSDEVAASTAQRQLDRTSSDMLCRL